MKSKKIEFKILEEDIRGVASTSLGLIFARLSKRYQEDANRINEAFLSSNSDDIVLKVEVLVNNLKSSIKELNQVTDLIDQIPDLATKIKNEGVIEKK